MNKGIRKGQSPSGPRPFLLGALCAPSLEQLLPYQSAYYYSAKKRGITEGLPSVGRHYLGMLICDRLGGRPSRVARHHLGVLFCARPGGRC